MTWRILYRIDRDAIVVIDVSRKKTTATPKGTIDTARRRLKEYDDA